MSNIKVAVICLARRGGMVHYHAELTNALVQVTTPLAFIASSVSIKYFSKDVKLKTILNGKGRLGTVLYGLNPFTYIRIVNALKLFNPDIVHVTGEQEWNPILVALIKLFFSAKIVYTVHDPIRHERVPWLFSWLDKITREYADAFIVHSEKHKQPLGFYEKPMKVIPMGGFTNIYRWKKKNPIEKDQILFFGRLETYKGIEVLLKAAEIIFKALPDWNIVIAGSGSIKRFEKYLGDLRIIVINKFLLDQEVANLFDESKLIICPYLSATQSGIIPLAFMFSKAVIASRVGAIPDLINDGFNGLLVDSDKVEDLAESIIKLAKDESLRKKLGLNGKEFVNTKLSWEVIVEMHMDFYLSILYPTSGEMGSI